MKTLAKTITIPAPPEAVFKFMDNLSKVGMHMSENSMMMMGSKLVLEQMPGPDSGVGATFHWKGKVMGMTIDIMESVTKWIENKEKVWETFGDPKIILLGSYQMALNLSLVSEGNTQVQLQISYTKPKGWFNQILYFFLAPWYCNWCLDNMLNDTKKTFERQ